MRSSTPTSSASRQVAEPGPLKTCAPRFSQYGAPRLRVHAPAEAVRGLEHEDVAVAEIPRRREATDPGADDDCISNR